MPRRDIRHRWCGGVALVFVGSYTPAVGEIVYARDLEHDDGARCRPMELLVCDACGRQFERLDLEGDALVAVP